LQPNDQQQILQLFDDGDRALVSADAAELERIFADDYIQYDESGQASTKQEVIKRLASRAVRFISMVSTERRIRLFEGFAIVHGSEQDEVEQDGQRVEVKYVYTDVVVKRAGRWQIVGSQLAKRA
jgi:ketosteroid isomerase-like protein